MKQKFKIDQVDKPTGGRGLIKMWEPEGYPFEPEAVEQIRNMAALPFIHKHVAVMPDAHAGKGSTVGTVIATKGAIIPAAVGVDIGCVDKDTEFLSRTGWKRLSEYDGDDVLVYDVKEQEAFFETPLEYVKRPSKGFHHFKTKYGIDQKLSGDHRVLTYKSGRARTFTTSEVLTAQEIVDIHHDRVLGFGNRFKTTPEIVSIETMMTSDPEAVIRVAVMVAADGHIDGPSTVLHFHKKRKFDRAMELLEAADIEPISVRDEGPYVIRFPTILDDKRLGTPQWWQASTDELKIIADEVLYWDGNHDERCFYTRKKEEADFVQWAFIAAGKRAVMRADEHPKDGKLDYRVYTHENTMVGIKSVPRTDIEFVPSEDGLEYCFTVSTGFFLIRRNGVTAITGNCGMMAMRTNLNANLLPDSLGHIRGKIEAAVPHGRTDNGGKNDRGAWGSVSVDNDRRWLSLMPRYEAICEKHPKMEHWAVHRHLGTLGTGNHFIEICLDEENKMWVMLHSGSRGVGNKIGTYFIEAAKREMERYHIAPYLPDTDLSYLVEHTEVFDDYVNAVDWAQEYAMQNRVAMMEAVLGVLHKVLPPFAITGQAINCHHNYVTKENHFGDNVLVTRKGAVQAREGTMGIIPGSMGTGSFIVRGLGNADSFCSCSHGAGRVMSRTKAKKMISMEDHAKAMVGIEARLDADIIDESPAAYKPINAVMDAQNDLVEIVHRLRQIVNVKG